MYWRIKTLDPKEVARRWAIPAGLVLSVLINIFQMVTRPSSNQGIDAGAKADYERFAMDVATHLLDSSYINYEDNTKKLLDGELGKDVVQKLKTSGMLPKSTNEMRATLDGLRAQRQVVAIHFREVKAGEPDARSLVPIDVKGEVAYNSADESGPAGPQPFHLRILVGLKADTQKPIAADVQEK